MTIVFVSLLLLVNIGSITTTAEEMTSDSSPFNGEQAHSWGDPLEMDMNISYASEGSFIGQANFDRVGYTQSKSGDFNGDGIDDILIGGHNSPSGGDDGVVYLFFGKAQTWNKNVSVSNADASFLGENPGDAITPISIDSAGDVNNDGYDDILIGLAANQQVGPNSGQTYLILGKSSGWAKNTSLANSDASFLGENFEDWSGSSVAGVGDVNDDNYDDILIGAPHNPAGGIDRGRTYLIFGKGTGWAMDTSLSTADVIINGETDGDMSGSSIAGPGDVNGNDIDDILIGAEFNDDGGTDAGKTYVIFGKTTGWSSTLSLSSAGASFEGETGGDVSGHIVKGAGDVNGDDINDILISSVGGGGPNSKGEVHLVLGRTSGWSSVSDLANSDASFLGENDWDHLGGGICGGDMNGDLLSDIVISSLFNEEAAIGSGQVYIFHGRSTGWQNGVNVTNADASFQGESEGDNLGISMGNVGDINSDGSMDLLIGSIMNDIGGTDSGKAYIITGSINTEPTQVYTFESYLSPYLGKSRAFDIGTRMYLELTGEDGNASYPDSATVNISFQISPLGQRRVGLRETGLNTGVYRGSFLIPNTVLYFDTLDIDPKADPSKGIDVMTDYPFRPTEVNSVSIYKNEGLTTTTEILDYGETAYFTVLGKDANPTARDKAFLNLSSDKNPGFTPLIVCHEIGMGTGLYVGTLDVDETMVWFENITATSVRDPSNTDSFMVHTPVQIRPFEDVKEAYEDEEYLQVYWNFGWETDPTWTMTTDKDWISFDPNTGELSGTPDNTELGLTTIELNLTDDDEHFSAHEFRIFVFNSDPNLIGDDLLEIDQDELYHVDYDCDDDGQGEITYYLTTSVEWLEMDPNTGVLSGTPGNDDVGEIMVSISVSDGNDGWDSRQFNITVINVNDPPTITTDDIVSVFQDEMFLRNYQAEDIDFVDEISWYLNTDAAFLSIDRLSGTLTGQPGHMDVGSYFVNVSALDLSGGFDFHNFTFEVLNVNDEPILLDFPVDPEVVDGTIFTFDVNATDHDDDLLTYYISSTPESDIEIDQMNGVILWTADIQIFQVKPYKLNVKVSVRDGFSYTNGTFVITVLPTQPPTAELIGPEDGERVSSSGTTLVWEASDPEGDPITYDLYLHQTETYVIGYRSEALIQEDLEVNEWNLTSLIPGTRYYWTIIPSDETSEGPCISGVQSFRVNYVPTFNRLEDQEVSAGVDLRYKISCTDEDTEDLPNLRYSLVDPPEGMTINEGTGMIRWTPTEDQVRIHVITVQISDGIDSNTDSFEIIVNKGETESSFPVAVVIIIVVVVLIIIIAGLFFLIKRKKKMDEEAEKKGEEERAELEKEEETGPSYEDLYGAPAPVIEEEDEEITTEELRDQIHDQIERLEQIETTEE